MFPLLYQSKWVVLYSYPLLMGLAWGVSYQLCLRNIERYQLQEKNFKLLFWGNFIMSWSGAKIFFLIFSAGSYSKELFESSAFWLGGGFVFLGGLVFASLYTLFICLVLKKYPLTQFAYFLSPLCVGHGLGRIGCFLAGCCYGTHCDLPWAVNLHSALRHPVQLYESITLFCLAYLLARMNSKEVKELTIILTYFLGYSALRFLLEFFRGDKIRGMWALGLSTSQWISLFIICIATGFLIYNEKKTA